MNDADPSCMLLKELEDESDSESFHSDPSSKYDDIVLPDWEPLDFDEDEAGMYISAFTILASNVVLQAFILSNHDHHNLRLRNSWY